MKMIQGTPRLVVCAAVHRAGKTICGPRHGWCLNRLPKDSIYREWECGFVDQDGNFMTRSEAWTVADTAGQIRRPLGFERDYLSHRPANIGDSGLLFSENLY